MSTPNFTRLNASRIYATAINNEDEFDNELEYQDTLDNIKFSLKRKGWHIGGKWENFASKTETVYVGDYGIDVAIEAVCMSGYYAGVNFDWRMTIDGEEYDPDSYYIDDIYGDMTRYSGWNKGFCRIQSKNLAKSVGEAAYTLKEELEAVYEEFTTVLRLISIASNGEALIDVTASGHSSMKP